MQAELYFYRLIKEVQCYTCNACWDYVSNIISSDKYLEVTNGVSKCFWTLIITKEMNVMEFPL